MSFVYTDCTNDATKFNFVAESVLTLTKKKNNEVKLINNYLCDLNKLDYRYVTVLNNDMVQSLIRQLCTVIMPEETTLVENNCKLLSNLIQNNIQLERETFTYCKEWILKVLGTASPVVYSEILLTLKNILLNEQYDDINRYLELLLEKNRLFSKFLDPCNAQWSEIRYHAVGCLEGILSNKYSRTIVTEKFVCAIKDIVLNIVSSSLYLCDDTVSCAKVLSSCLHILHIITISKLLPHSTDFMGEILGVVQAFLFYGLRDYPPVKPLVLRPIAMNLPEQVHVLPKSKNLKTHKVKTKKQSNKKVTVEEKDNSALECRGFNIPSSDSDASDSENTNFVYMNSKVRLEAVRLLQALVKNSLSREIFGFWPQIIATGSRSDARVLSRSILKEPVSKVKQNMLSTLTELLIDAKPFLIHAEDTHQTSFITFFGTVGLMIKELHFVLSLILSGDKNVAVLTHALKCSAALIQGTPYARLKAGLAIKLMRNCRSFVSHKDPTVRVAALSSFEAIASCDPITSEIFGILAKQSNTNAELNELHSSTSVTDNREGGGEEEKEKDEGKEEKENEDLNINTPNEYSDKLPTEANICFLLHLCLQNVSDETMSTPVRLQSLKLIGRMAFSTASLVFSHIEFVTTILVAVIQNSETQVILHACRALEIMAGCFLKSECNDNKALMFWNIIFEPMTLLLQHSQVILREAACDCLGSINPDVFTQLSRQKAILIITVLFAAVRDEESAVRAAALRALGMLVTLPSLQEDTGFLMDLSDIVCSITDDKNLGVRIKGVWALANFCDCISKKKNDEEVEPLPLEILLPKLYRVSIKASKDSDKVKCNAVRALGSILYLCPNKCILTDTSSGLEALINCAILGNDMKVRWNACRALGLVLSSNPDNILQPSWRDLVFPTLCKIICNSPNFKVRTNAAWALYSCNSYGKYVVTLWRSIILAFENSQHVPSYIEYPHRDALLQQLCLTLSHVAAYTQISDLQTLWAEVGDHIDDTSNYIKQFQETIVPEKSGEFIKAKSQFEKYARSAPLLEDRKIAQSLACVFEKTKRYDNLDVTILTS